MKTHLGTLSERLRLHLVMDNGRAGEPFGYYDVCLTEKKLRLEIRTQLTHQIQAIVSKHKMYINFATHVNLLIRDVICT